MSQLTLYTSNHRGNLANCIYSKRACVTDELSLIEAVKYDHVAARYRDNYRKSVNFIESDTVVLDCDNDHSDESKDWVDAEDVVRAFPGVGFAIVYSRNHMKKKGNKSARPRFHIYFKIDTTTKEEEYTKLKQEIAEAFIYFDSGALDSARLIFGTKDPKVKFFKGTKNIDEFISENRFAAWDKAQGQISEGSRNNTMSQFAGRIIKRYGSTDEAFKLFLKEAEKCQPPLPEEELNLIWNSARNFGEKIAAQEGYIPPEEYNADFLLKPSDFSDVGQAVILAKEYEERLRYSPATDFIVYNDRFWEESKPKAQAVAQELTTRQLEEAEIEIDKAVKMMGENGALDILLATGPKKAQSIFNDQQKRSYERYENAMAYKKYAVKRRDSKYITSALKEVRPMLEIEQSKLDVDEFLLNTPSATYDLRKGIKGAKDHSAYNLITKQTTVVPSEEGKEKWQEALNTFFCNDRELIGYVQKIVGLASIGKVYVEALIIAYGDGRNGKSTFWNVIARVLGSYSGNISADILTVGCRRNVKPELAEAKGKRLLIAAELEEGMRLNTSNIKQLCSTDEIYAEKKYKDPFSYIPSHTLVLYTNHLPKVGAIDEGTWRRLIVIPFEAKIEGSGDIKNYADYLYTHAGGAILSWIIEGARKVIEYDYHVEIPEKVQDAIGQYRENNNWLGHFLNECCEVDNKYEAKSGEVYDAYRAFCIRTGEFIRSTTDFYTAIDSSNFKRYRDRKGRYIKGLRLKSDFLS